MTTTIRTGCAALAVAAVALAPVIAEAGNATVAWRFEMDTNYVSHRPAIAEDGTIYVNDANGILYALTPDGLLLWTYDGVGSGSQGPTVLGDDGTIYFGTAAPSQVHAVNPDGTSKWIFEAPDSQGIIGGPGVGPDGNIYAVFDIPGDIGAISLSPDGDLLWNTPGDPVVFELGQVGRELVFGAGQVYWTSKNTGALYAFDLATGNQEFRVDLDMPGQAATGKKGIVYVASGIAPRLFAIDANGNELWQFFGDEPGVTNVLSAPDTSGGRIFINRNLSQLYALSGAPVVKWMSNSLLEQGPVPGPIVNPTQTLVLIAGQETFGKPGRLEGFDPANGDRILVHTIPKEPDGSCAVPNARPMFTDDGLRAYIPAVQLCVAPADPKTWLYAFDITL